MKRRSFIGALVATFATPAEMLAPQVPLTGFVSFSDYTGSFVMQASDDGVNWSDVPLMPMEVGRYEGFRFIESPLQKRRFWRVTAPEPRNWFSYDFGSNT